MQNSNGFGSSLLRRYIIGLGSNLPDRLQNLRGALSAMSFLRSVDISCIYQSKALLLKDAPSSWNKDFLNCVVAGFSDLSPTGMLQKCKQIELKMGRTSSHIRWSPRVIDIDILLLEDSIIKTEVLGCGTLNVPHPEMLKRLFVLLPICDIAPELTHPITGRTMRDHLQDLKDDPLCTRLAQEIVQYREPLR
ncbi:2-amino-4-hydroxy-6-hydroxymethyldihydropteridine diphosphokinase [Rickettsiales endosymbiont of Peranema trichophorum]|uniref:2-amino-4-hydroxy-6- hydroxymethyldihydropteridine diphosphokinase n=1 Tax=Rickettsiales endosymbiont of Peranema trichophorum TaxID=2486577 RepID=UPI0010238637|nr:2-amino-4-hydroxy-6-hydroxymethyldihydropteridine diphosphokinase [Rickettsiales endosymbiont of Peranema trichophorum]RZI47239.1 2-amino-4-hydroxy-6-hydroxymethyldihydropteridine diphosphokinase [Rickettsiales endosymbiont of Peranema trichophorum]